MSAPWLVLVDLQPVFGDPGSPWATPGFDRVVETVVALAPAYGERVVCTRFVAPGEPQGSWADYYDAWPFALQPPEAQAYALDARVAGLAAVRGGGPVVTCEGFDKWGPELDAVTDGAPLVVAGVSTECCVLTTVLSAAAAGRRVTVLTDAVAAVPELHAPAMAVLASFAPMVRLAASADVSPRG